VTGRELAAGSRAGRAGSAPPARARWRRGVAGSRVGATPAAGEGARGRRAPRAPKGLAKVVLQLVEEAHRGASSAAAVCAVLSCSTQRRRERLLRWLIGRDNQGLCRVEILLRIHAAQVAITLIQSVRQT